MARYARSEFAVPTSRTLTLQSLAFHWRINLATLLGVAVGTATLAGALMVGDSMRASLRRAALQRLGPIHHALVSDRFVRESLSEEIRSASGLAFPGASLTPAVLVFGSAEHATSRALAGRVRVYGVDDRFWSLAGLPPWSGQGVRVNAALAKELTAAVGDEVLIRLAVQSSISPETLLGRRDRAAPTLRLPVDSVLPEGTLGDIGLSPSAEEPKNIFVPIARLQRSLDRTGRVNVLMVAGQVESGVGEAGDWQLALKRHARLDDYESSLRTDADRRYVALESARFLLEPAVESAADAAAGSLGRSPTRVLTYLANRMAIGEAPNGVPYSTVTAFDTFNGSNGLSLLDGTRIQTLEPGQILLNDWAATELGAKVGDTVRLTYYVTDTFSRLQTKTADFRLNGVVELDAAAKPNLAADPGLTPAYPGVTDSERMADWDPPFPVDLKAVRTQDEDYWKRHRATPKAFVSLADGQRIWSSEGERFGRLTSIRFPIAETEDPSRVAEVVKNALLAAMDPAALGLSFRPVRQSALAASVGTTDFGVLFVSFSMFLVASSAMLVALLFRLQVERRTRELGLLMALGFTPGDCRRRLMAEGAAVAALGSVFGVLGALGYAYLMIAGLRSWWSDAVQAPLLGVHVSWTTLALGALVGFGIAVLSTWIAAGAFVRRSARALLAGAVDAERESNSGPQKVPQSDTHEHSAVLAEMEAGHRVPSWKAARTWGRWVIALLVVALMALPWLGGEPKPGLFFLSGAVALGVMQWGVRRWLRSPVAPLPRRPGWRAIMALGARNARRAERRSMTTAALIGSATFLIVGIGAFRIDPKALEGGRSSGTGGFGWVAESAVPLLHDLNTPEGREALNLANGAEKLFHETLVIPFRVRPGDEASCRGMYQPRNPRLLGATEAMVQRGGFGFAGSLAEGAHESANPWLLLERPLPDGAIPVMGDEAAVRWQLHSGLGKDFEIRDERGRPVQLRFVALLQRSMLQSELVMSEANLLRLFPSLTGYSFFLIDSPVADGAALERAMADYGFDVTPALERLTGYLAVQNTYLRTFQTLGGLGLVLGAFGLVAVMLRNVWERKGELALLQAVGFTKGVVGWVVLAENAVLIGSGLLSGLVAAVLAVLPQLSGAEALPWGSILFSLSGVVATGLGAGGVALAAALSHPLVPALRAE